MVWKSLKEESLMNQSDTSVMCDFEQGTIYQAVTYEMILIFMCKNDQRTGINLMGYSHSWLTEQTL